MKASYLSGVAKQRMVNSNFPWGAAEAPFTPGDHRADSTHTRLRDSHDKSMSRHWTYYSTDDYSPDRSKPRPKAAPRRPVSAKVQAPLPARNIEQRKAGSSIADRHAARLAARKAPVR